MTMDYTNFKLQMALCLNFHFRKEVFLTIMENVLSSVNRKTRETHLMVKK